MTRAAHSRSRSHSRSRPQNAATKLHEMERPTKSRIRLTRLSTSRQEALSSGLINGTGRGTRYGPDAAAAAALPPRRRAARSGVGSASGGGVASAPMILQRRKQRARPSYESYECRESYAALRMTDCADVLIAQRLRAAQPGCFAFLVVARAPARAACSAKPRRRHHPAPVTARAAIAIAPKCMLRASLRCILRSRVSSLFPPVSSPADSCQLLLTCSAPGLCRGSAKLGAGRESKLSRVEGRRKNPDWRAGYSLDTGGQPR